MKYSKTLKTCFPVITFSAGIKDIDAKFAFRKISLRKLL